MTAATSELQATSARGSSESLIKEIEHHVAASLTEMFRRALKDGVIKDRKDEREERPLPPNGLVQDCEFGMILLMGREWLEKRNALPDSLQENAVRELVLTLVAETAAVLFDRKRFDVGGEYGDVFFRGAPYTRIAPGFAANLDAAMLVVGFFAPALKTYHTDLAERDAPIKPVPWVQNLRDLALYICKAGIDYATACQVRLPAFAGFSCDPKSLVSDTDKSQPYLDDFDRLFYTWTAAETIHDLLEWKGSLSMIAEGVPAAEVAALRSGIQDLEGAIEAAARWCKEQFFDRFLTLKKVDVAAVVAAIDPLKDKWLEPDSHEQKQVNEVEAYVQHVYHMSQYAAIRSLWPTEVTIDEVDELCDRLDRLVMNDILGSNLDASEQSTLFLVLTRTYRLGKGVPENLTYDDDAYYPLVVRSMAALLTRTMDRLVEHATRNDISEVVLTFRRVLRIHYDKLIIRRPKNPDDRDLWSFAARQPYILYATQRTIFALLAYVAFLEKMDEWEKKPVTSPGLELEIRNALSRALVDNVFGSAIKEIVSLTMAQASGRRGDSEVAVAPLPRPPWAARAMHDWLQDLGADLEAHQFADNLMAQAEALLVEHQLASAAKAPADKKLSRQLSEVRLSFAKLFSRYGISDQNPLVASDLLPHLLRDLLDAVVQSIAQLKLEEPEWFELVKSARGVRELIKNREGQEERGS